MSGVGKKPDRFHSRALPQRLGAWIGILYNTLPPSLPNSSVQSISQQVFMVLTNEEQEKIGVNFVGKNITNI